MGSIAESQPEARGNRERIGEGREGLDKVESGKCSSDRISGEGPAQSISAELTLPSWPLLHPSATIDDR